MNRNERLIMLTLLQAAFARGWILENIWDGDQEHKKPTLLQAMEIANNLDECHWNLKLPKDKHPEKHVARGWVYTIFGNGNDGLDVISDHTVNLSSFYDQTDEEIEAKAAPRPRPHGFMDEVDAFRDELERYWHGDQGWKPECARAYLQRDLEELHAGRARLQLQQIVIEEGKRGPTEADPEGDELLPAEQQAAHVATAMQILELVKVA